MNLAPPLPPSMRHLPLDSAGRPVPFFASWVDGQPDFRVADPHALMACVDHRLCWVCGYPLGSRRGTFAIGPMCAVNRVSAEPPSHAACAEWSAQACPFLNNPDKVRREAHLPSTTERPGGVMLLRNPGVTLLWTSRTWEPFVPPGGGLLFDIGEHERVAWWARGRPATHDEIVAAIDSGTPALREIAEQDGPKAVEALDHALDKAMLLVPSG